MGQNVWQDYVNALVCVTSYKLQVYDFLFYFSHKQPDDGYFVAEKCNGHL
jgi:hypothetical protein